MPLPSCLSPSPGMIGKPANAQLRVFESEIRTRSAGRHNIQHLVSLCEPPSRQAIPPMPAHRRHRLVRPRPACPERWPLCWGGPFPGWRKESAYPELLRAGCCRLVVLAVVVSEQAASFVRSLARVIAREVRAATAWWTGLLTHVVMSAFAASLAHQTAAHTCAMSRRGCHPWVASSQTPWPAMLHRDVLPLYKRPVAQCRPPKQGF